MSMLIEINRGPDGIPGELVDARTYIRQLQTQLKTAEQQAAVLQEILVAAGLVVGDSADGYDAVANLGIPHSQDGNERMQRLVDAIRAYDRRAQP